MNNSTISLSFDIIFSEEGQGGGSLGEYLQEEGNERVGGGILNGWEAREMGGNYAKMLNILQSRKS